MFNLFTKPRKNIVKEPLEYETLQDMVNKVAQDNVVIDVTLQGGTKLKIYKKREGRIVDPWSEGL